ncbi:MAG: hypothetical protein HQ562_01135 [Candidatus Marinimicrobia bacterium]|nr:hypothetical protein [Candidatus Neomarinimicrobiota bacterium]
MTKIIPIIILILSCANGQVASDYLYTGVEATALAGAVVANPGNSSNLYHNPAGLAEISNFRFRAGSGRVVNIPYLDFGVVVQLPWLGSVGISGQSSKTEYHSTTLSSEQTLSLSNGFDLQADRNSRLMLGYSLHYYSWELGATAGVSGDGSDGFASASGNAFGLDIGFLAVLRGKHRVGAYLKNVNSPQMGVGESSSYLPRRLSVGIAYVPFTRLITSLNMDRLLGENILVKGGIQYALNDLITFRLGAQSNPNRFGGGIELKVADVGINYSLLNHPVLPLIHQFGITFAYK